MHELPGPAIVHLANQVGVPAELYPSYEWSGRTIKYHRVQIREHLGFRESTVQDGGADTGSGKYPPKEN